MARKLERTAPGNEDGQREQSADEPDTYGR